MKIVSQPKPRFSTNERSTIKRPIESVGTPKEALLVSLNEKGRVDLDHMAGLLDQSVEEFLPDLKGMIFLNPQNKQWETEDQYLSGNVREKLVAADAASVGDPRFRENVEALKSVQPQDLPATEIDVRLGATWLPEPDVEKFVHELLGVSSGVQVSHIHALGSWHITADWEAKQSTANTTDWGTSRYTGLELIEDALNLKTPTVYDMTKDKKPVVNRRRPRPRGRNRNASRNSSRNGFGRMMTGANGCAGSTTTRSITAGSARSTANT